MRCDQIYWPPGVSAVGGLRCGLTAGHEGEHDGGSYPGTGVNKCSACGNDLIVGGRSFRIRNQTLCYLCVGGWKDDEHRGSELFRKKEVERLLIAGEKFKRAYQIRRGHAMVYEMELERIARRECKKCDCSKIAAEVLELTEREQLKDVAVKMVREANAVFPEWVHIDGDGK